MHFLSFVSYSFAAKAAACVPCCCWQEECYLAAAWWAQAPVPASISDPFAAITLIIIMVFLALIIGLLAYIVLGSAELYLEKVKATSTE